MPNTLKARTVLKLTKIVAITIWIANLIYIYKLIAVPSVATGESSSALIDALIMSVAIVCGVMAGLYVIARPYLAFLALAVLSIAFCIVWVVDTWRFILPEDSYFEHFLLRHNLAVTTADKINTPLAWLEHINWWYLQPVGQIVLLLIGIIYPILVQVQSRRNETA